MLYNKEWNRKSSTQATGFNANHLPICILLYFMTGVRIHVSLSSEPCCEPAHCQLSVISPTGFLPTLGVSRTSEFLSWPLRSLTTRMRSQFTSICSRKSPVPSIELPKDRFLRYSQLAPTCLSFLLCPALRGFAQISPINF